MSTVEYIIPPKILPILLAAFISIVAWVICWGINYLRRDGETDE